MNMKTSNAAINWQLWSSNAFARYLRDLRDGRDLDRNTNCDNPCRTTFCYVTGKMHDFPLDWLAQSTCLVVDPPLQIHHIAFGNAPAASHKPLKYVSLPGYDCANVAIRSAADLRPEADRMYPYFTHDISAHSELGSLSLGVFARR